MRICLSLTLPPEELGSFLATLRTWEAARSAMHMEIAVDAPELTTDEMEVVIERLSPPLSSRTFLTR